MGKLLINFPAGETTYDKTQNNSGLLGVVAPFIGRAVGALAADLNVMGKTGKVLLAAGLAQEFDFTDIDGSRPFFRA
jgi:hypothetical protein